MSERDPIAEEARALLENVNHNIEYFGANEEMLVRMFERALRRRDRLAEARGLKRAVRSSRDHDYSTYSASRRWQLAQGLRSVQAILNNDAAALEREAEEES